MPLVPAPNPDPWGRPLPMATFTLAQRQQAEQPKKYSQTLAKDVEADQEVARLAAIQPPKRPRFWMYFLVRAGRPSCLSAAAHSLHDLCPQKLPSLPAYADWNGSGGRYRRHGGGCHCGYQRQEQQQQQRRRAGAP